MAVMFGWMITRMFTRTRTFTNWTLSATGHWWIYYLSTTFTEEFFERGTITGRTVAPMTRLITLMLTTRERIITGQWTEMIDVYAAFLITLVLATGTFFSTAFLASSIVGTRR